MRTPCNARLWLMTSCGSWQAVVYNNSYYTTCPAHTQREEIEKAASNWPDHLLLIVTTLPLIPSPPSTASIPSTPEEVDVRVPVPVPAAWYGTRHTGAQPLQAEEEPLPPANHCSSNEAPILDPTPATTAAQVGHMQAWTCRRGLCQGVRKAGLHRALRNHIQFEKQSSKEEQRDHIGRQQGVGHIQAGGKRSNEVRKYCRPRGRAGQNNGLIEGQGAGQGRIMG